MPHLIFPSCSPVLISVLAEIIISAAAQNLMDLNNTTLEEIDKTDIFPLHMQEIVNLGRRR